MWLLIFSSRRLFRFTTIPDDALYIYTLALLIRILTESVLVHVRPFSLSNCVQRNALSGLSKYLLQAQSNFCMHQNDFII